MLPNSTLKLTKTSLTLGFRSLTSGLLGRPMSLNPYAAPKRQLSTARDATPQASRVARGRVLVLIVIVCMLLTSLVVITAHVMLSGTARLPGQVFQLSLTAFLCFFAYRGMWAARLLLAIFCALGGLGAVWSGNLATLPLAAVYLTLGGILAFSPSVSAYFEAKGAG